MRKLVTLIVDDSWVIIERFTEILNDMDNVETVLHANNYHEGSQMLKYIKPDVVLLDINLPDKSGIELLRLIQTQHTDVKVIMITNHVTDYYKKICAGLGADHFFDKSNEFELIPGIISGIHVN
ncbi:MAG: response regulator [Bacteroidetes bacterium]|nr:response regulator [Bacteroidota bacterium]